MYQEDNGISPYSILGYGAAAIGGFSIIGRTLKPFQSAAFDRFEDYMIKSNLRKGRVWEMPKWMKTAQEGGNPARGFWSRMSTFEAFGKKRRTVPFVGAMIDEARMYAPRVGEATRLDKAFYKGMGRELKDGAKMVKMPAALGFGMLMINQEVNEHGLSGIASGAAKEVGATAGARLGGAIGSSLGHMLSGRFVLGGPVGFAVGMVAGGVIGYGLIDNIKKISRIGKNWTLPDLGGNFKDSQFSQTMRQRSMNAIRTSQFNLRSELGNEAFRLAGL